jgi:N-acylneuraminate cytidylyltransferase
MTADCAKLAVIPARGGSKRIPRKNIRLLAGKPLLAYTVEAALLSGVFTRVVVSTDDKEIAAIAKTYGAEVPFLRDAHLADDQTHVSLVTLKVLEQLDPTDTFMHVCQLMPNCPFRTAEDIQDSFRHFLATGAETQLSVTRYGWLNPWWAFQMPEARLEPLFPEALKQRSQDLPALYCPSGAIWWATAEALRRYQTFHSESRTGFELSWQHALDIDDEEDWAMAEVLVRTKR